MRDAPKLVGVGAVAGLRTVSPAGVTGVSILSRTCGFAVGSVGFSLRVNIRFYSSGRWDSDSKKLTGRHGMRPSIRAPLATVTLV
jgi:hypothetical protein